MEKLEKLIAEYSQTGHPQYPEDTWDWEMEIGNVDELYQFMKNIHKRDAYHFNDFPLNGECSKNGFKFFIEESIIVDGKKYIGSRKPVEHPAYFNDAVKMYDAFYLRLRSTLPNLRKAADNKRKENSERSQLEYLKSKYE